MRFWKWFGRKRKRTEEVIPDETAAAEVTPTEAEPEPEPEPEPAPELAAGTLDVVPSLQNILDEHGFQPLRIALSFPMADNGELATDHGRETIWINHGNRFAEWHTESLRDLMRGTGKPPSDRDMDYYPPAYAMLFRHMEQAVVAVCNALNDPIDSEFVQLYVALRKRPDGRSSGPLHDAVWQGAALGLGLFAYSAQEFSAVCARLARSARTWKSGAASRNYIAYLRDTSPNFGTTPWS